MLYLKFIAIQIEYKLFLGSFCRNVLMGNTKSLHLTRCANKKIMVFWIQISAFLYKKLLFCQPELVEGYQLRMLRQAQQDIFGKISLNLMFPRFIRTTGYICIP